MFAFELIFIITVMASILFFSNFSNKKIEPYKLNEIFKYTKSFFLNNKIEKKINTKLQLEFLKKFHH